MSAWLFIARPLPGTVGETRRVAHLFPEPTTPDTITAYCGAAFGPHQLELLDTVGGMPCEACLARSPRP
ncbi:hypothetical protein [Amycolatopsis pithecellobii]|uniref:Uncharacterized protein n=1 Tax=Amycolatopsis pithecellobii TaxID=664692 RepID=A0A6N7YRQ9_9PSEU|nr:hypothetical protein [Amycolatopsis pithecellobii]MTD55715.1 hypothetical protein [Amycolatopsis pithecellobii]